MNNNKDLSKQAREVRNAYLRQWRKDNPEKTRQHQRNYWEKKAQELQEEGAY